MALGHAKNLSNEIVLSYDHKVLQSHYHIKLVVVSPDRVEKLQEVGDYSTLQDE